MTMATIFQGTWKNENGSILKLIVEEHNHISGMFCTNVGRLETKDLWQDTWFNVVGFINGHLISFSINYHSTKAIGCQVGNLESEGNEHRIITKGFFMAELPPDQKWRQTIAVGGTFCKSNLSP